MTKLECQSSGLRYVIELGHGNPTFRAIANRPDGTHLVYLRSTYGRAGQAGLPKVIRGCVSKTVRRESDSWYIGTSSKWGNRYLKRKHIRRDTRPPSVQGYLSTTSVPCSRIDYC